MKRHYEIRLPGVLVLIDRRVFDPRHLWKILRRSNNELA